ncbi:uncharacterized protein V1510DRAFT_180706, partial [Dipodascopsis tothii]|uniref:uncharacterized protein n=1 Tax=Dipodascopsis tothii TaxID=44089 RepID=UPI0034CD6621
SASPEPAEPAPPATGAAAAGAPPAKKRKRLALDIGLLGSAEAATVPLADEDVPEPVRTEAVDVDVALVAAQPAAPAPAGPPSTLQELALSSGLGERELRALHGRRGGDSVQVVDFNLDEEYARNRHLRSLGLLPDMRQPVHSIGSGRHQLSSLIACTYVAAAALTASRRRQPRIARGEVRRGPAQQEGVRRKIRLLDGLPMTCGGADAVAQRLAGAARAPRPIRIPPSARLIGCARAGRSAIDNGSPAERIAEPAAQGTAHARHGRRRGAVLGLDPRRRGLVARRRQLDAPADRAPRHRPADGRRVAGLATPPPTRAGRGRARAAAPRAGRDGRCPATAPGQPARAGADLRGNRGRRGRGRAIGRGRGRGGGGRPAGAVWRAIGSAAAAGGGRGGRRDRGRSRGRGRGCCPGGGRPAGPGSPRGRAGRDHQPALPRHVRGRDDLRDHGSARGLLGAPVPEPHSQRLPPLGSHRRVAGRRPAGRRRRLVCVVSLLVGLVRCGREREHGARRAHDRAAVLARVERAWTADADQAGPADGERGAAAARERQRRIRVDAGRACAAQRRPAAGPGRAAAGERGDGGVSAARGAAR